MAPKKKIITYKRSNTSLVNNSVDALNVLFSTQKPNRIINKKRKKREHLIKNLLARPKCLSVLANESFQISMEDTFDKLFKKPCKAPASVLIHNSTDNNSKSLNKSEVGRFITADITIDSPILTKRKKNFLDSSNSFQISEIIDSYDKSHLKRFKEPSEEKIDESLEIDRIEHKQQYSSLSYINVPNKLDSLKIPNSLNCSKLGVSIDNFSKSLHRKLLTNCSTPVLQFKHPNLINQTMSPLKVDSLVQEESSMSHSQSKNLNKTEDISKSEYIESERSDINTPKKRESFIILRKRKVLKTKVQNEKNKSKRKYLTSTLPSSSDFEKQGLSLTKSLNSFNDSENQIHALTTSLESFSKFENKVASIYKNLDSSKDFKSIEQFLSPANFVTKRRGISKDIFESTDDVSFGPEEIKDFDTNKKLEVKLEKLPLGLINSSTTSLESDFEKFYSQNISNSLENTTDKSLENFEKFYTSNYVCDQNSDQCEDESFVTLKKNSTPDVNKKCLTNLSTDEFEKFYVSHHNLIDSKDVAVSTSLNLSNKNNDLYITKESLRSSKKKGTNCLEVSNDLSTDSIEKEMNKTDNTEKTMKKLEQVPCNVEIIDLTESTVETKKAEGTVTGHNGTLRIMLTRLPKDNSNFPLPTVENVINLADEKSLDVIESSYTENPPTVFLPKISTTIDTKFEPSQMVSTNKSTKSGTIQNLSTSTSLCQILVNNSCDIVDKSRVNDSFKLPKSPTIHLKGGKSWKRSMSVYRLSIGGGFSKEDGRSSYLGKTCPKGKLSKLSNQKCCRKLSVCLAPLSTLDLENATQNPIVEYALRNSYVPDQIIEGSLEDSFRCLSLNHVNTVNNKSRLDQVPITAEDVVLRKCGQTEPLEFSKCFPDSILSHCHKIGEGVFGEVFLFRNPIGGTSVIKIVPVEGDLIVNGERQKKFKEVLSEIIITTELSNLRNNKRNGIPAFTEVQKIQCVRGRYPEKLIFLWDEFDETRGSENDCPDIFRDDQLYIVFQMAYGGKDLESFEFNNAMQAYSMFQQVAIGLAVAEEELRFEHRDLHWGNVLVSTVETNKIASFNLNNRNYELPTMGVEVAIIDFTLSRIEHDGVVIFNDLSMDPDLFGAEGDYQFDIYRLMQDKNRNNWKDFEPFTNLLWLHYILDKAVKALRYRNVKSKRHRDYLRKLKALKEDVLCYHNVKEFVFAKLLDIII